MTHLRTIATVAAAALLLAVACAKKENVPPAAAKPPEPAKPTVEPAAEARLRAASATLSGTRTFTFATTERHERVNAGGEKKARESTRKFVVARPNKLWMERLREGETARAVYDGAALSIQGDKEKVWSQVDMPPTLDEALDYAAEVYRFPMPVADFLYSDPYSSLIANDTAASLAGQESIHGVACDRVAIRTPAVEADVWIEAGERALPCKLEIVYKDLDQKPRSTIVFSDWNLSPTVDAKIFEFSAPGDYRRIAMVAVMSPEEEKLARKAAEARARIPPAATAAAGESASH